MGVIVPAAGVCDRADLRLAVAVFRSAAVGVAGMRIEGQGSA